MERTPAERLALLAASRPDLIDRLLLVFDSQGERPVVRGPDALYAVVAPLLLGLDHERMVAVWMDQVGHVIGTEILSSGSDRFTVVDVRFIMRKALLANAARFALAHNHPSGNSQPSEADLMVTYRLRDVGELMTIQLCDHLIVAGATHHSMAAFGEISSGYHQPFPNTIA